MFPLLDCYYLQFLPLPSVPCPKPSTHTPPFHPELWASPWEVIYNAIGVTIIRLHTISLCPLCLGRLLWATFLFAQKHIVRPSSENTQKHLAQTGTGRLPMSKISDTPSSVTISGVFCFFFQLSDFTVFKVMRKTQKGNGGMREATATDSISFHCSVNNYVQILLSCRYHSTWDTDTISDSPAWVFVFSATSRLTSLDNMRIPCHGDNIPYEVDIY